jgi:Flp pilus assembly pilin Flp
VGSANSTHLDLHLAPPQGVTTMNKTATILSSLRNNQIHRFVGDTRGANLVEYIILVGVIALIAIAGFKVFGTKVQAKIEEQSSSVGGINGAAK